MLNFHSIEPPQTPPTACVIWLHGLGADGHDFVPIVPQLQLGARHAIEFVFPHAPSIPVTLNGGMLMPAWYDIVGLNDAAAIDEAGIRASAEAVLAFVASIQQTHGLKSDQIVLAGFSQGGVIALNACLHHPEAFAGVLALSTYLPLTASTQSALQQKSTFLTKLNASSDSTLPIFMAHGTLDPIVELARGQQACKLLQQAGFEVTWQTYPMAHAVCAEEIEAIATWLKGVLHVSPV